MPRLIVVVFLILSPPIRAQELADSVFARLVAEEIGHKKAFPDSLYPSLEEMHWLIEHQFLPPQERSSQLLQANDAYHRTRRSFLETMAELNELYANEALDGSRWEIRTVTCKDHPHLRLVKEVQVQLDFRPSGKNKVYHIWWYFQIARINRIWHILEPLAEAEAPYW